jgi:hypothetical protein
VKVLLHLSSSIRIIDEWSIEEVLKWSGSGLINVLSWNSAGRTEEHHEILSRFIRCPGRDPNQVHPEYVYSSHYTKLHGEDVL